MAFIACQAFLFHPALISWATNSANGLFGVVPPFEHNSPVILLPSLPVGNPNVICVAESLFNKGIASLKPPYRPTVAQRAQTFFSHTPPSSRFTECVDLAML
jgi:hypothetical protein